MVVSKLDKKINYKETKELNKDDMDYDVTAFILEYDDIPVIAALGKEKYTYSKYNVVYVPIYVIHNSSVVSQIGVYEILLSQLPNVLDENSDIDVDRLDEPLYYSFVNSGFLSKYRYEDDEDDDDEERKDKIEDDNKNIDDEGEEEKIINLEEGEEEGDTSSEEEGEDKEGEKDDTSERVDAILEKIYEEDKEEYNDNETYSEHKRDELAFKGGENWVQDYLKNTNFEIIDNEGGGDCFFAVIREAYKSIGKQISVSELRLILSNEANEKVFEEFKNMYDMFNSRMKELHKEMNTLRKENTKLSKEVKKEQNVTNKKLMANQSKKNKEQHTKLRDEYYETKELMEEFKFMENVNTLDDFKEVLKTNKFWAETWAISTLERVLNMKMVILSTEAYERGDIDSIIMCGQLNDDQTGAFNPKYYIMTEWLGNHYKTISYKDKKILTYSELPYSVKEQIVNTCLVGGDGTFGLIPKFKTFKKKLLEREDVEETIKREDEKDKDKDEGIILIDDDSDGDSEDEVLKIQDNKDVNIDFDDIDDVIT